LDISHQKMFSTLLFATLHPSTAFALVFPPAAEVQRKQSEVASLLARRAELPGGSFVDERDGTLQNGMSELPLELSTKLQVNDSVSGDTAPLTEEGYRMVASLRDDQQMLRFMERVLSMDGQKVQRGYEAELAGMAPWYDGNSGEVQSLESMRTELGDKVWILQSASFTEDGYKQVLSSGDLAAMRRFILRLMHSLGLMVAEDGYYSYDAFTKMYSDPNSNGSFERMRREVEGASWVQQDLTLVDRIPLTQLGYATVVRMLGTDALLNFMIRLVYASVGPSALNRAKMQELRNLQGKYQGTEDQHTFEELQAEVWGIFGCTPEKDAKRATPPAEPFM